MEEKIKHITNKLKTFLRSHNHFDASRGYVLTIMSLVGLIVFMSFPHAITKLSANDAASMASVAAASATTTEALPIDPFASTTIAAKAALVYDMSAQKIIYSKNASEGLPLASLTKIMTAITAADLASTSTIVTIQRSNLGEDGDSGLLLQERWSLQKLLQYSLVVSSNDGAAAVAEAVGQSTTTGTSTQTIKVFVAEMNRRARLLGLKDSVFFNPTGLDESTSQAGAYGSAIDVAKMLMYAVTEHLDIFALTRKPEIEISSMDNILHTGINTDILASKIPGLVAGKTGYTDLAGGNLAVVFDMKNGHRMIVVVLGSTYDGRFSDVETLVNTTIKNPQYSRG